MKKNMPSLETQHKMFDFFMRTSAPRVAAERRLKEKERMEEFMVSEEIMNEHQIQKVWKCLRKEESLLLGHVRGFLCECANGKWLAVTTEGSSEEQEVLILNTKGTATKRLRERGYFTVMSQVYPK